MKTMKRLLAIALVLTMVLSLVACGTTTDNDSAQSEQISVQNVSMEDATDETTGDETGKTTGAEDIEREATLQEGTAEISVVVGSETKQNNGAVVNLNKTEDPTTDNKENVVQTVVNNTIAPNGEYNKGIVLVKVKESFNKSDLGKLAYTSAEPLYTGSKWYSVQLSDADKTEEAVTYLADLGTFAGVDYDYVMGVTAKETENPDYDKQTNLGLSNIPYGWTQNGKHPGGNPDVVIAVIDTGVDYTHLDLRNNIWNNTAEIANNGKDDDGNGYVDDVYGWDCVGNDKDPMDDNGHGTHVAGIIAAENNKQGGIGVAYNCKVMVLKAGNSSGYFNNSDIAEAIQYAYMNGASVINMSFGGSQISIAVDEALENAYNSCVLVAAAGNDGACNDLNCKTCDVVKLSYPAALPYVIGVMSTDKDGGNVSSFSNYDHNPYNSIEYEVYAVGEGVGSTWPSNKYACLNGTSMAAPTVAGIAALLRSHYYDREVYSTKFIQSQIVNTGTVNPHNELLDHETDYAHSVADVQEALTKLPKPAVNLYDYRIDDSTSISKKNNDNGVVDAGETVRLYISLHNRGGVASDVNVSIDTDRGMGLTDPYFTFVNSTMKLSDIGTYSVRESGEKYFEIVVSDDCPNDYLVDFNIRYTYKNGMDEKDKTVYQDDGRQKVQVRVNSGFYLPAIINESITYSANKLYIINQRVTISESATVVFEEGCQIQYVFEENRVTDPSLYVYGTLHFAGSSDNMIKIIPSQKIKTQTCLIMNYGYTNIEYADIFNLRVQGNSKTANIFHSLVECNHDSGGTTFNIIDNCYINNLSIQANSIKNSYMALETYKSISTEQAENNIFMSLPKTVSHASREKISITSAVFCNNAFVNLADSKDSLHQLVLPTGGANEDCYFSDDYKKYATAVINNYILSNGDTSIDIYKTLRDNGKLWPHVVNVEMFNTDGELIATVGREEVKVRVTFNRSMDTSKDTFLTFGTIEPYADYRIDGEWISDTVWEGTYTLKAQIENGQNFLKVNNACAAEDPTKTVLGEYQLHEFTIDTTEAMSMNLQAIAKENGIELTWMQDDYDTLMGYNIYRSESKDGNYVKLNPAILLSTEESFLDENAEPGKTYWYTFTVVLSDFSESAPAGKVMATTKDTQSPSLYHTPVNQGYENNNLVISCTASDNVAITNVTLYYRTVGASEWKTLSMVKQNDKYSATIYGSDVTMAGIEYYILATDGVNIVNKGDVETPYTIVVKFADSLLGMGDVDGNGNITTKDALMLMQCLNGDLLLEDDAFKRADLNGDGVLSSAEALRILQYVNGKVTTLEM